MWPFRPPPPLDQLEAPARRTVTGVVTSPNDVQSPLSGLRAAAIVLEIVEQVPVGRAADTFGDFAAPLLHRSAQPSEPMNAYRRIQRLVLGSTLTVQLESVRVELPLGQTSLQLAAGAPSAEHVPAHVLPPLAEIMQVARASCREGPLCYRELALTAGTRVTVDAHFDVVQIPVARGYRSGAERRTIVRPDLGPVFVTELLDALG